MKKEALLLTSGTVNGSITNFIDTTLVKEFLETNICIPKGENRHPYADELHEWVEGANMECLDVYREDKIIWNIVPQFGESYQYRIKPSEPVYEWQYAFDNGKGNAIISDNYYTDAEYATYADDKAMSVKLNWTKRLRK